MTKINQEEYHVLKSLSDKWEWIARDSKGDDGGNLFAYLEKTFKRYDVGGWDCGIGISSIDNHRFRFIQWEDEEPYNIAELIGEYESEETEVKKDKEWAQKEVDGYLSYEGVSEARNALVFAKGIIDRLDEPEVTLDKAFEKVAESYSMTKEEIWRHLERFEAHGGKVTYGESEVLSQEWIDKHVETIFNLDKDFETEFIKVDDLQNLLLSKQELTAIPQHVARYLNIAKRDITLMRALEIANRRSELPKWEREYDWISANDEKFARAWLDGYEVEEKQMYYVLNSESETMIRRSDSRVRTSSGFKIKNGFKNENYKFTEQEIKEYDKRFWPFAVKVEELEEND